MLIALDYDGTYTLDPDLWDKFILMARFSGHEVIIATMRNENELEQIKNRLFDRVDDIVFTSRKSKVQELQRQGYHPDIWIDDNPYYLLNDGI